MDVRVCGPNLANQTKGSFHVHRADCLDLRNYGPNKVLGGDVPGNEETLVENATVEDCVLIVYDNGIIDEHIDAGEERKDVIESLVSDFWFAPCTEGLPYSEEES